MPLTSKVNSTTWKDAFGKATKGATFQYALQCFNREHPNHDLTIQPQETAALSRTQLSNFLELEGSDDD